MPARGSKSGTEVFCRCCGTMIYSYPSRPRAFCSIACRGIAYIGDGNPKWRGGKSIDKDGYVYRYQPLHPHANKDGNVYEHRLVMESAIGRLLSPEEEVHHKNQIKDDNSIGNLKLMENSAAHRREHSMGTVELPCQRCGVNFIASAAQHKRKPRSFCGSVCTAKNSAEKLWTKRRASHAVA